MKHLIVDSGGGETSAALKIANVLFSSNIEIHVQNRCLSSCANYFFLGTRKRTIENGIVGYHGNVQACFGGEKWARAVEDLKKQGLSDDEIELFHLEVLNQIVMEENMPFSYRFQKPL